MQFNTIGQKIGLGFTFIAAILGLAIGITVFQINKSNNITDRINNLRKPTATASLQMLNGINQSLAALRGWMILGKESFRKEREDTWENKIEKPFSALKTLSINWTNQENIKPLNAIESKLSKFKNFQQEIEDIAQTSKNFPAKEILKNQADPLASKIIELITTIIEIEIGNPNTAQRKGLFKKMADFRGSMGMSLARIQAFLNTANENNTNDYEKFWVVNTEAFNYLEDTVEFLDQQQSNNFNKIIENRNSLEKLIPKMLSIRESSEWNISQNWLETKAAPIASEIKVLLEEMTSNQQILMEEDLKLNKKIISNLQILLIIIFFLSAIVSTFIGVRLKRKITNAVQLAVQTADQIAMGNLDNEIKTSDIHEINLLGNSMQEMQENLSILNRELEEKERRILGIIDTTVTPIIIIDKNGIVESFNKSSQSLFGYSESEVIGKNIKMLMPSPYKEEHDGYLKAYANTGNSKIIGGGREVKGLRKNGTLFPLHLSISVFESSSGVTYTGVLQDLTKLKESQKETEDQKIRIAGILDTALTAIIAIDQKGIVQSFNKSAQLLFGYSSEEVVGQNIKILMPSPYREEHDGYLKAYMNTGVSKIIGVGREVPGLRKNGKQFPLHLSISKMETSEGIFFNGVLEDLTELKESQTKEKEAIELLSKEKEKLQEEDWVKTQLGKIIGSLQGVKDMQEFASIMINKLTPMVDGNLGVFYFNQKTELSSELRLYASYAYSKRKSVSDRFQLGEGLVGQCGLERKPILLTNVPKDYIQINSGLGEASPQNIIVLPVVYENQLMAVFEIASFKELTPLQNQLLEQIASSLGIMMDNIIHSIKTQELLEEAQRQSEELQTQQVELKASNEELEKQRETLEIKNKEIEKQSLELQNQQVEMKATNEELEKQSRELEDKNRDVEEKSKQLAQSSKYKSEFLANMSHELRTPLNSLLVLSKILSDGDNDNLTEKQKKYATTIHDSGSDLLELLNDVLDLSKIEAGKIDLNLTNFDIEDVKHYIERLYDQVAIDKSLQFEVKILDSLPSFQSDIKRLQQILVNLLSNAFKFTEQGSVTLEIAKANPTMKFKRSTLNEANDVIAFSVIDTGIGIQEDKIDAIFEAFQQADGGTSRKYGGTGLGLSICREFSNLLHGEIRLESVFGQGSRITLFIPATIESDDNVSENVLPTPLKPTVPVKEKALDLEIQQEGTEEEQEPELEPEPKLEPVRNNMPPILIFSADSRHTKVIKQTILETEGQVITKKTIDSIQSFASDNLIGSVFIDTDLPLIDELTPLEILKRDPHFNNIPFYAFCKEENIDNTIEIGVKGIINKSKSKKELKSFCIDIVDKIRARKKVLLVEDDRTQRKILSEFIATESVSLTEAITVKRACDFLDNYSFDCLVLDLSMPDKSGLEFLKELREQVIYKSLPVIIYTAQDLSVKEERELEQLSQKVIIKSAKSPQRLLEELAYLLSDDAKKIEESNGNNSPKPKKKTASLKEKSILVVDDDMRNVFAITSAMENFGAIVNYAQGGKECIDKLSETPSLDLILMDIMMPGMDGYKAIEKIRLMKEYSALPIIVITAKSMKGEREKCIKAGASDYLTKPLNMDVLVDKIQALI